MPFRILTIPFDTDKGIFFEEELTVFCMNRKVNLCKPEFFRCGDSAYWTVFIEYEDVVQGKVRREEHLEGTDRLLFQRLREWRKEKAEEQGVPVFIIATNRLLMDIITMKPTTLEGLKEVRGFGKKKTGTYGEAIIGIIRTFAKKPSPAPPSP